MCVMFLTLSQI